MVAHLARAGRSRGVPIVCLLADGCHDRYGDGDGRRSRMSPYASTADSIARNGRASSETWRLLLDPHEANRPTWTPVLILPTLAVAAGESYARRRAST
jgi:hypothetical protein